MKILFLLLFAFSSFPSMGLLAQDCEKGDYDGRFGRPQIIEIIDPKTGKVIRIVVIAPLDPNEIIGPSGYDSTVKWVSAKASLPYKILFENDPEFATAPAQKVILYLPIHPNLNPNTLRLGDFGFGPFVFTVPPNTAAYTQRLDVRDTLGLFVDVTAGLDAANRRAFWIFESIDPATGLAGTLPADQGFLPINDKTKHNGEGFVTLTLQAASTVQTRDSLSASASIIFDVNEAIVTNTWGNLVDAVAPSSQVNSLPALVDTTFTIGWTGRDDSLGSGVQYYSLYVSRNNAPFGLYGDEIDSTSITFTGEGGATYSFFTLATDNTGNKEALKTKGDQTVTVRGTGLLVSLKAFLQGPFDTATGLMTDSLRAKALLPMNDPYPSLGFTPVKNTYAFRINAGVLDDSVQNKNITDWVWIELRNKTNPAQVVSTRTALLRRDGNVVDMDGESPVYFNGVADGNYFIALRHRNHLGVMTAAALSLTSKDTTVIDFTSPSTAIYGTDAMKNQNGIMLMWGGNANGDKLVRYNGAANDKNAVLGKVGLLTQNNVLIQYDRTDVNMDGMVRYVGAKNDKDFILRVIGLQAFASRVITEQLPN